ncbi:hypothetical protein PDO_5130 [Rhizobium sp. PDO1-076]|uniref:hypothetical protein n=1 Tax=Rhizobium sp. PDO1-076 TaxID=1125979 RepID=UPI00024E30B4|nr:hypothetical protein [Rhizobium sp. PDO1-076]EHS51609.1 hypothetical protein PDO_5130 [Rhizobium sp. PDO1-076]
MGNFVGASSPLALRAVGLYKTDVWNAEQCKKSSRLIKIIHAANTASKEIECRADTPPRVATKSLSEREITTQALCAPTDADVEEHNRELTAVDLDTVFDELQRDLLDSRDHNKSFAAAESLMQLTCSGDPVFREKAIATVATLYRLSPERIAAVAAGLVRVYVQQVKFVALPTTQANLKRDKRNEIEGLCLADAVFAASLYVRHERLFGKKEGIDYQNATQVVDLYRHKIESYYPDEANGDLLASNREVLADEIIIYALDQRKGKFEHLGVKCANLSRDFDILVEEIKCRAVSDKPAIVSVFHNRHFVTVLIAGKEVVVLDSLPTLVRDPSDASDLTYTSLGEAVKAGLLATQKDENDFRVTVIAENIQSCGLDNNDPGLPNFCGVFSVAIHYWLNKDENSLKPGDDLVAAVTRFAAIVKTLPANEKQLMNIAFRAQLFSGLSRSLLKNAPPSNLSGGRPWSKMEGGWPFNLVV